MKTIKLYGSEKVISEDLFWELFDKNPEVLENIEQTHQICLKAVRRNGKALGNVMFPNLELTKEAVKQNPWALTFALERHLTPEVCILAIDQDPIYTKLIDDMTPELCVALAKHNPDILGYIDHFSEDMLDALDDAGFLEQEEEKPYKPLIEKMIEEAQAKLESHEKTASQKKREKSFTRE